MAAERPTPEQVREVLNEHWQHYGEAYKMLARLFAALMLVGIGVLIGAALFQGDEGYGVNLYTEVLSIAVTVFILDYLNRRRDERNAEKALKEQLIRDAGSTSNEVAKNAVHQMRKRGWLTGENGLLEGENLEGADLQQANLRNANLRRAKLANSFLIDATLAFADLDGANLEGADLRQAKLLRTNLSNANLHGAVLNDLESLDTSFENAKLQNAKLVRARLRGGRFIRADLRDCFLQNSNLHEARLQNADLRGAWLHGANLDEANLQGAIISDDSGKTIFDAETILPDGSYWSPGRDMREFTHPDEWAREHPSSQQP